MTILGKYVMWHHSGHPIICDKSAKGCGVAAELRDEAREVRLRSLRLSQLMTNLLNSALVVLDIKEVHYPVTFCDHH